MKSQKVHQMSSLEVANEMLEIKTEVKSPTLRT